MDFSNRGNRTEDEQQTTPQGDMGSMKMPMNSKSNKKLDLGKLSSLFLLFGGAILIAALLIALVFGGKDTATPNSEASLINTNRYQAVFLNSQDGQVYFGKLAVYNDDVYVLNDIYYVRVENPIQPEGADQVQQPSISLAKLGSELHGPEDVMFISRDKVLYWENLKDDGQVVTAITEYKANGGTSDQQPAEGSGQNDTNDTPTDTTP